MKEELIQHARQVLSDNDRGTYTVPTHGLYPFQWNWDSALSALGFAHFDEPRAWTEIDTLMAHQWEDGMVPHIIFHQKDDGYFPGPDVWATGRTVPTSGITQPPVAGFAVRRIHDRATDKSLATQKAKALLPKIHAWHQWFYRCRDPQGTGLIALANGGLSFRTMLDAFTSTGRSTAMIFFIVLGAAFYNGFLALTQVPQELSNWVVEMGLSPFMVLSLILLFYLVFGCLMDSLSMILLTIPIFFPVISVMDFGFVDLALMQADAAREVLEAGIPEGMTQDMLGSINTAIAGGVELTREQMQALDIRMTQGMANRIEAEWVAIWFGILVLIVVEVGLITPPVGMNLFIINSMDRSTPMMETYKAVIWFVASDLVRVILLVLFPAITLFWLY